MFQHFTESAYQGLLGNLVQDPGSSGTIALVNHGVALVNIVTAGAESRTLRGPSRAGQIVNLNHKTAGGTLTLTIKDSAASPATTDTYTLASTGFVTLMAVDVNGTLKWLPLASQGTGGLDGSVFDTLTVGTSITFSGASDLIVPANTAAALEVYDSTTKIMAVDTRNTLKNVHSVTFTGVPVTVASEAAAHINATVSIAAKTITYTGTTGTTSSLGCQLHIAAPTFTNAMAQTLSLASSVHITAVAAAGGMLTLTAARMISTSVADAYLTNAGVWTDTMCWEYLKENVNRGYEAACERLEDILRQVKLATWTYKDVVELPSIEPDAPGGVVTMKLNDFGRQRAGILYDDLPDELRAPGEESQVASGFLGAFSLAVNKMLFDRLIELETRLAALGG